MQTKMASALVAGDCIPGVYGNDVVTHVAFTGSGAWVVVYFKDGSEATYPAFSTVAYESKKACGKVITETLSSYES